MQTIGRVALTFATVALVLTAAGCPNKGPNVEPVVNGDKDKKGTDEKGDDLPVAIAKPPKLQALRTLEVLSVGDKEENWRAVESARRVFMPKPEEYGKRPTSAAPGRLAFSPDGGLLMAHARIRERPGEAPAAAVVKLWELPAVRPFAFWFVDEISYGNPRSGEYSPALAVSPDGKRLFASFWKVGHLV